MRLGMPGASVTVRVRQCHTLTVCDGAPPASQVGKLGAFPVGQRNSEFFAVRCPDGAVAHSPAHRRRWRPAQPRPARPAPTHGRSGSDELVEMNWWSELGFHEEHAKQGLGAQLRAGRCSAPCETPTLCAFRTASSPSSSRPVQMLITALRTDP